VVPPSAVPEYVRAIYREVMDRGPALHILTGPIFVNGAMPGDVLEVRILEIDLAVPYGFNASAPIPAHWRKNFPASFSESSRSIAKPRRPRSHRESSFH
jgi:hypothetical protein